MQLTSGDRKILLIAAGVFVLLLVATAILGTTGGSQQEIPSTYSTASGGTRAAYLLLKESGYSTRTWEQPLRDLPAGKGKVLILAEPVVAPATEDRRKLEDFLRSGGHVVACGVFASYYLPVGAAIPEPLAGMDWKRVPSLAPSSITRAAPEISLAPAAYWGADTGAIPLYGDSDKPVVVHYQIGEGDVLWMASATPLTNAGLKQPGNLEFMLTAVGAGDSQVLWDEFIHGYQRSTIKSASMRVTGWIEIQLALFAIAILLAYSRRSGPIWTPTPVSRLSPLEFVRTLGLLYQHANAGSIAVDISYQRFRYMLTRRLGLSVKASIHDLDRAVHDRWDLQGNAFGRTLGECESCRYDPDVPTKTALHLVQSLFDYARSLRLVGTVQEERNKWKRS